MASIESMLKNVDANQLKQALSTPKGQAILKELKENPDIVRLMQSLK